MSKFPRVLQGFDAGLYIQQIRPDVNGVPLMYQVCTLPEFYDLILRLATVRFCARYQAEERVFVPLPEHLKTKYLKHLSSSDVRGLLADGNPDLEVIAFWSTVHLYESSKYAAPMRQPLESLSPLLHGRGLGVRKGVSERAIRNYVQDLNTNANSYVEFSEEDTQLLISILSPCHAMFVA